MSVYRSGVALDPMKDCPFNAYFVKLSLKYLGVNIVGEGCCLVWFLFYFVSFLFFWCFLLLLLLFDIDLSVL